jgi:putative FmdB family regulatory protein
MPIYAYRCHACGFAKDVLQSISAAPLTDCESCGKPEFRKQVTAAGFQLKGSGWYVTDFRNGATPPAKTEGGAAEASPAAPAAGTATTATTTAPATPAAAPAQASTTGATSVTPTPAAN